MAVNKWRFYLGRLGYMRPMRGFPTGSNPTANTNRFGSVHNSLYNTATVDTLGIRRSWEVSYDYATMDEIGWIHSLYQLSPMNVRLMDLRMPNLLHRDVSAGGTVTRTGDRFITTSENAARYFLDPEVPAELQVMGLDGAIEWTTDAAGDVLRTGLGAVPVVDDAETYIFSVYARVLGTAIDVTPIIVPRDSAGTELTSVAGTAVTLSNTYQRIVFEFAAGDLPPEAVAFAVGLEAGGMDTVYATGWQLQIDDPDVHDWTMGGGCPEVIIPVEDMAYPRKDFYTAAITLQEVGP